MTGLRWLPALLLGLLALPFDPFWIDFEAARRALLLLAIAAVLLLAPRRVLRRVGTAGALLLALVGWNLLRSLGTVDGALAQDRALHLAALAALFLQSRGSRPTDWLVAALPIGLLVSGYGLLQALGLTWPPGYGGPAAPVSTLGNLNYASELAAVTGAAAAMLLGRGRHAGIASWTLMQCAAYLLVNGSRSGMLALPLACLLAQAGQTRRRRLSILAALISGACLGLLARPGPAPRAPRVAATASTPSTVAVRLEIWKSCLEMAREHPLQGCGTGQFRVEYPRYRSAREIELSTHGRRFAALPATAHDDHLEILVETGLVGLALWWGFLALLLAHGRRSAPTDLALLVAFLALSLVRSPLGNAPVAALVLGHAGALRAGGEPSGRPWHGLLLLTPALLLAWVGLHDLLGQSFGARYQRDLAFPTEGFDRRAALDRALAWAPNNPQLLALRAQESHGEAARQDWQKVGRLRPNDTGYLVEAALLAMRQQHMAEARGILERVLALDPRHPQARRLLSVLRMPEGPGIVLELLYADPHPRLREQLGAHLHWLASHEKDRTRRRVYLFEAAFIEALDALQQGPGSDAANRAVKAFADLRQSFGLTDARPRILTAVQALALGLRKQAERIAPKTPVPLSEPDRRLMAPVLRELLQLPAWARALGR